MKFIVDSNIFERFGGLNIGVLVAKNLNNKGVIKEVNDEIRGEEKRIGSQYSTESLSQDPRIGAWRKAYSVFGAKPKDNRSSVENLYRLVLQGSSLRHINNLVDIYNLISLKHMLPVGGEDIDKINGNIVLTFAEAEPPVLLLGDREPRPPHKGEVIYKDDISAICRRWNWREADRTKLTEETKNCIMVIEGLPPITKKGVENAAKELKELVQKYCGGTVIYTVVNEGNPEVKF